MSGFPIDIDPEELRRMERIVKDVDPAPMPIKKGGRPTRQAIADREAQFLYFLYDEKSPHYGDQLKAGRAAEFPPGNLRFHVQACIEKYSGKSFKECAALLGMNRPWLASKLRMIIEDKETEHRTKVVCVKLILNNLGEKTEDGPSTANTTNLNFKQLVIVGDEAMKQKLEKMVRPIARTEIGVGRNGA